MDSTKPDIPDGEHLIGAFIGDASGPTLIVVGSLHGNEPAGASALLEINEVLRGSEIAVKGRIYFVAGNTRALRRGLRFVDHDLNRAWTQANTASLGTLSAMESSEGCELTEIDQLFDSILITAKCEVYVLDLHSTSATGVPFATVGDTVRNRSFARKFPVTILLGIEEQLEGTMLEYLNNTGAVTLGFEGGSHTARSTVDNHAAMVWLALLNTEIVAEADIPDLQGVRDRFASASSGGRIIEVIHRESITDEDGFVMNPGFNNFDHIISGQVLARNKYGEIRAGLTGLILMPLYQKLGEDGFFIGREVAPFWLAVSSLLRSIGAQKLIRLLPGVAVDPDDSETLTVDTKTARLFPLQIFHLLGFRRRRWTGDRLIVTRRKHDTVSPFVCQS